MSEVEAGASSVQLIPGVLSDDSRVVRRRFVLLRSSRPSAGGGPAEVDSHREFAVLAYVEKMSGNLRCKEDMDDRLITSEYFSPSTWQRGAA